MITESVAELDFEERQEASALESEIMDDPESAAVAIVALRKYCRLLETGLGAHEARESVWGGHAELYGGRKARRKL